MVNSPRLQSLALVFTALNLLQLGGKLTKLALYAMNLHKIAYNTELAEEIYIYIYSKNIYK